MKKKRLDLRPICSCGNYKFPHKLDEGKCNGEEFAEYHFLYKRQDCEYCNLNNYSYCDAATGAESIKHGECYEDAKGCGVMELIFK